MRKVVSHWYEAASLLQHWRDIVIRSLTRVILILLAFQSVSLEQITNARSQDVSFAEIYNKQSVMIPMRDGVRLYTEILHSSRSSGGHFPLSSCEHPMEPKTGPVDLLATFSQRSAN